MSSAAKITLGVVIAVLLVGVAVIDSIANKPKLVYERGVATEGRPGGVLVRAYVERVNQPPSFDSRFRALEPLWLRAATDLCLMRGEPA